MIKEINDEKIPIKLWLSDIELETLNQARNLANFPFAFRHIALMADSHQGYGMPIGGVLATKDVIVPNAVGVDIGCGMCALKTSLPEIDLSTIQRLISRMKMIIPVGFDHHKQAQDINLMPIIKGNLPVVEREFKSATKQLGTLGGGNHFIEIQKGSDGYIWIMVHSGSRNIGKQVADNYNRLAVKLNDKYKLKVPRNWELAYLFVNSDEGSTYLREMNYCIDFALSNRLHMIKKITELFMNEFPDIEFEDTINIAHNFAMIEEHFKQEVMVHRKGATQAYYGQLGIIPGSQGSKSFIIAGKGNIESFKSCSHGAGRKLGRKQAMRVLNLDEEKKKLDKLGILHSIRTVKDLDEAAGAYKDIEEVMKNQVDLVDIIVELSPLAVVKG